MTGSLRVTDAVLTDTVQTSTVKAPTTSGGTTYGAGTSGQVLKTNGTTAYWGDDTASKADAADITTTANAVAIYTDANGTFGTKATSNGAAYATSTNGALTFGTLPVAQGGTGQTTGTNAANYFMNSLDTGSSTPVDADYYISQYVGGGTTTKTYHRRPMSALWEYIKGKISSILGISSNTNGIPLAPTATAGTNTTQVATTAFVKAAVDAKTVPVATTTTPKMDGTAAVGSETKWAKGDHVHPTDTSRAPLASPAFTGTPTAPTANYETNSTQIATTAYVDTARKSASIEYIVGTQTAATNVWTGNTVDSELYIGKTIAYKLPFAGTSSAATLNLTLADGETTTGAKNVYLNNNTGVTTHFPVNTVIVLVYDGTYWRTFDYNTNDNYLAYRIRRGNGTYKSVTALYRYQFLLTYSETQLLPINAVNNSTATNKTLTTEPFDPFGEIYYYPTTTTISAGANIGVSNLYTQYEAADLRYSFNTGSTLTAHNPIYIVAVPQSNGKAVLHTAPISQDLPTTEDGLIYICIGRAYDTYRIEIDQNKPVYYYKDSAIRLWTNPAASPQQQADWNETNTSSVSYIKNKPTIPEGASASSTTPKMDGTATVGTETAFARGDHIHPTDTSRAALASPTFTGTPKAPTAAAGTSNTQIATTAFVDTAINNVAGTIVSVSIPASAWSNKSATVTCAGVTSTSNIIVTSDPSTMQAATEAGVYCSAQGTNSLTFSCLSDEPSVSLTMDVWIGNYIIDSITYAPLSSPAFTGTPTAPTATTGTSTTQIATTAFVANSLSAYALKASPAFTGTPTAPTATSGDSSTQIATTAFVANAISQIPTGGSTLIKVNFGTISSLPQTVSGSSITSDMEVISAVLGTPTAQDGDWTVTTANGSVTVSGTITGTTTLVIYLSDVETA